MAKRTCALALCLALCAHPVWAADRTTLGIDFTLTHGTHRETGGVTQAPLIPAPVITIAHRHKRFEFSGEGLPPIGPIPVANSSIGIRSISLSYINGTVRYWNRRGTVALGLGESLYDQRTKYLIWQNGASEQNNFDGSRVAGTRYEIVGRFPTRSRDVLEASFALDPSMHGRMQETAQLEWPGRSFQFTYQPLWEQATEVDAQVRYTHHFGSLAMCYGARYLNYVAVFRGNARPGFADANTFFMPFVSIQRSFAR